MTDQELINLCESFTVKARTATTKLDLLTIAFAAKAFYQNDWGRPLNDIGHWISELDKRIQHISSCADIKISTGNDLSSFKQDLVDALSSLCGNFTYSFRKAPKD